MEQLKFGDLLHLAIELSDMGMSAKEINELPVYLGDDDEMNGIHCGWYSNIVDADNKNEDSEYYIELINENRGNIKLEKGKAIVIS